MAIYKGIEIDNELAGVIRYMAGVEDYREGLGKLQSSWDILTLLGQLTGAATEMSGTREGFERLTAELLNHLGKETQRKALADLRAKTQVSIDILVRNLFERTADIGFLAADDDIREHLLGGSIDRSTLERRFHEYVEKYSVYADIVLFANDGRISARLSPYPCASSEHALIEESRITGAAYVEYFGPADFLPPGDHLIYAYRVESANGETLGVLALVFRLADEMAGIFGKLVTGNDSTLLVTVDPKGVVVATASTIQLPVGTRLDPQLLHASGEIVRLAGCDYLATVSPAHSYQGYPGPGWLGLGLVPLEFAFEPQDRSLLGHIHSDILDTVSNHSALFSDELRQIPDRAENIQEELNRSVWNGSVRQIDVGQSNASFAKTLLWEISNTGRKTQAVFEHSIGNLHQTVVATLLQNGVSLAAFAIDVMDRNLYERANDCRWWGLNPSFRHTLASEYIDESASRRCSEILAYINGLYTVYDNLILFNAHGQVIGVSNSNTTQLVGARLSEEWVSRCLTISSSQGYVVSKFQPTALYGGQATYIYAAPVFAPDNHKVVGGIAIVFDSTPQFTAMLNDTLPKDESGKPVAGAFALFTQNDGKILASTDPTYPAGQHFPITDDQKALTRGGRRSAIIELDGSYFAVGAAMSAGYREYKTSDGHVDDVLAITALPLGKVAGQHGNGSKRKTIASGESQARRVGNGQDVVEIATFFIGNEWLGLPVGEVVEAIGMDALTPVFGGSNDLVAGVKSYRGNLISVLHLQRILFPGSPVSDAARQIVVIRTRNKACIGLLVDELGEIPEIAREEIQSVSHVASRGDSLTVGIVSNLRRTGDRHDILSILSADRFCQRIACQCPAPDEVALLEMRHGNESWRPS